MSRLSLERVSCVGVSAAAFLKFSGFTQSCFSRLRAWICGERSAHVGDGNCLPVSSHFTSAQLRTADWTIRIGRTQRAPVSSVYNALWPGGALMCVILFLCADILSRLMSVTYINSASWVTFGSFHMSNSWSWRLPSAFQALPSIFQVILILFGPESPRWLIAKHRHVFIQMFDLPCTDSSVQ